MKAMTQKTKDKLWEIWSQSKKPGHTMRTYAVGMHRRSVEALANRGLLRRMGRNAGMGIPYEITAAGRKLAVELFG